MNKKLNLLTGIYAMSVMAAIQSETTHYIDDDAKPRGYRHQSTLNKKQSSKRSKKNQQQKQSRKKNRK